MKNSVNCRQIGGWGWEWVGFIEESGWCRWNLLWCLASDCIQRSSVVGSSVDESERASAVRTRQPSSRVPPFQFPSFSFVFFRWGPPNFLERRRKTAWFLFVLVVFFSFFLQVPSGGSVHQRHRIGWPTPTNQRSFSGDFRRFRNGFFFLGVDVQFKEKKRNIRPNLQFLIFLRTFFGHKSEKRTKLKRITWK